MSVRSFFSDGLKPLNCDKCFACCIKDAIILHPELGDVLEFYETDVIDGVTILKHGEDSKCIYLDPKGKCGIYPVRPAICKEFDCRITVKVLGYTRARKLVKQTLMGAGVINIGLKKLKQDRIK